MFAVTYRKLHKEYSLNIHLTNKTYGNVLKLRAINKLWKEIQHMFVIICQ